ncbi:hypothetical protein C8J57DRAFT_1531508 [Mycena rebaudengoi]|nr:hypothetical protein C8J57DRAFT_1531508 [Mycena rebaudengoi]
MDCRREVADSYPDNSVARKPATGICCDNCLNKTAPTHPLLVPRPVVIDRPGSPGSDTEDSPHQEPDANGKRGMNPASRVADRREDHLKDKVLTAVATKARLAIVADLIRASWSPTHSQKHGDAVLELLRSYNFVWHQQTEAEKAEKARLPKEKTLADRQARTAEAKVVKAQAAALRRSLPKPPPKPRASRAKKSRINQENHPLAEIPPQTPLRPAQNLFGALPPFSPFHSAFPTIPAGSSTPFYSAPLTPTTPYPYFPTFSRYLDPAPQTPIQRGSYTIPITPVPNLISPYYHYSPSIHPPPYLQPPHPSFAQNSASAVVTPTDFYSIPSHTGTSRPRPTPRYRGVPQDGSQPSAPETGTDASTHRGSFDVD